MVPLNSNRFWQTYFFSPCGTVAVSHTLIGCRISWDLLSTIYPPGLVRYIVTNTHTHAPSRTSSSCCPHCVLVLCKGTDLLTVLNTFCMWCPSNSTSNTLDKRGKKNFPLISMFLFIWCGLHGVWNSTGLMCSGWLMKAIDFLKKEGFSHMDWFFVSTCDADSLINS